MSERKFRSVNIFDPDIAYAYSDALAEYDCLILGEESYIVEELSSADEWKKCLRDVFLSIALPPRFFNKNGAKEDLMKHIRPKMHESPCDDSEELYRLYRICPEMMNMWFYANLIISPYFTEKYINEIAIEAIDKLKEQINEISENEIEEKKRRVKEILESARCFLILPQFGIGKHRAEQIRKSIAKITSFNRNNARIILGLNKYLKEQYGSEIDEIRKGNKVEEILLDRGEIPEEAVIIVFQDYSKGLLSDLLGKVKKFKLIVIPETYYWFEGSKGRAVRARSGFLEECKDDEVLEFLSLKAVVLEGDESGVDC